ncbi:MAG: serine hydrolase [Candidatus Aminicenantes bacterium]|nr:serine hydrolase [Candidatus Aminicenantes bacterium]
MKRMQRTWILFLVLAAVPGRLAAEGRPEGWRRYRTPEEAGWSGERLAAVCRNANAASVFLVHDGRVVFTYGECRRRFKIHSMRKSILSALVGIAVGEKEIDLRRSLAEIGIADKTPLTEGEGRARILDLLKARSGVYLPAAAETSYMKEIRPARGSHAPGEFFYYNNWDFNALGTIYCELTGHDIFADFERRIAQPLGMQDFARIDGCYNFEDASIHPAYNFMMSARDLARFGQLFLQQGKWRGRQVVPEKWVRESTSGIPGTGERNNASDDPLRYGYLWYEIDPYRGQRLYFAAGHYGQRVVVAPAMKTVLVLQSNTYLAEGISDVDFVVDDILFNCRGGTPAPRPEFIPLEESAAFKGMKLRSRAQAKYCKAYSDGGAAFAIRREGGGLVLAGFMPNYLFRLLPLTSELFRVEDIDMYVFFSLDERGIPQQARIHKSPLAKEMLDAIAQSGMEKARERFPEWRKRIHSLEEMTDLSRELQLRGIDNLEILKLSAEAFPYSFRAQQALNSALMKKGGLAASAAAFGEIVRRLQEEGKGRTKTEWLHEILRSQADPQPIALSEMDEYAGNYGPRRIAREGSELVYFVDPGRKTRLFRIHADEFSLQGQFFRRLRFARDGSGRVVKLVMNYYRDSSEESARTEGDPATDARGAAEK